MLNHTTGQETTALKPDFAAALVRSVAVNTAQVRRAFGEHRRDETAIVNWGHRRESAPNPNVDYDAEAFSLLVNTLGSLSQRVAYQYWVGTWNSTNDLDLLFCKVQLVAMDASGNWGSTSDEQPRFTVGVPVDYSIHLQWQKSRPQAQRLEVVQAPRWLAQRMAKLQRLPPPTLQQVDTQMRASAETRAKLIDKPLV